MLTKDDLQAIGALIKTEGEAIRKDMATKSDLKPLQVVNWVKTAKFLR